MDICFFSTHSFVLMASKCCRHHTPPLQHTHVPGLDPFIPVPPGADFYTSHTWITQAKRRGRGRRWWLGGGGGHAVTVGLRWRWTATPSTQHDTQTDRAARETLEPDKLSWLLWEWEGRGGKLVVGAGPVTQEWRRLTAHVKFMVFPGLQGNTSQRRDR